MKKFTLFAIAVLAVFAIFWSLRTPDTDRVLMTSKYSNAASKFAENSEGLRVHYRDQGNPNGIPIILIHGTASSLHTWEPLVKRLGDRYRIISYTQPGHGLTGPHPLEDYSFAGMAQALELVADELTLDQFVLGGNAMGGWVAWRYAIDNPNKVDALLLLDAAGMPQRDGEKKPPLNLGFRMMQNPVGRYLVQQYTPRMLVEKSALQSVSVKSMKSDATVDRYWELLRYPGNRRAVALRAIADRELGYTDRELEYAVRISEVNVPALVLWGAEDQLIFVSAAQSFKERMADARVVIYDGVGHLPMEEAPNRAANDIGDFLSRVIISD